MVRFGSAKRAVWLLAFLGPLLVSGSVAHAQNLYIWQGGNNNWNPPANWSGPGQRPETSDDIARFTNSGNTAPEPGFGRNLGRIEFTSVASGFTLTGGSINLFGIGGIGLINDAANAQSITSTINLQASQTWQTNAGSLSVTGPINFNSNNLTLSGAGNVSFSGQLSANNATILRSGTGNTTISGSYFGNASTVYRHTSSGTTTFTGGALQAQGLIEAGRVDLNTSTNQAFLHGLVIGGAGTPAEVRLLTSTRINQFQKINILEKGLLNLNNFNQTTEGLIMTGGTAQSGTGTLTFSNSGSGPRLQTNASSQTATITGNLAISSFSNEFSIADGAAATDALISAPISGNNTRILKTGDGTLRLTGANTFGTNNTGSNSAWNLQAGVLEIIADNNLGAATNNLFFNGGTLRADGTFTTNANRVLEISGGNGTLAVTNGNTLTLAASNNRIIGSGTLTREGVGTLVIQNSNSFSGNTVLNAGTTRINNHASLGTNASATITINNGSVLEANFGSGTNLQANIVINDGTIRRTTNNGTKAGFQNNNSGSSLTVTGTGNIINDNTGGFLTLDGLINVQNNATLNLTANSFNEVRLGGSQNINLAAGSTLTTAGNGFVSFGSGAARTIIGQGSSANETTIQLGANTTANAGTRLEVNGSGTGGLRIEGTAARVNVLANDTRLNQIAGSGGTLTLAYTDNATRNFTAASNAASPTNVKLGFDNASGSAPNYNLNADHSNWNGLVVKGGQVTLNSTQGNYTGGIEVSGGTLLLGSADVINNSTAMTLSGGTFATGGLSDTLGTLTLTTDSTINLGAGASVLQFASAGAWTGNLSITNWSGDKEGGGDDQLYIGSISPGQLAQIRFINPAGFSPGIYEARLLASGEIVPVPEPAAIFAGLALLALAAWKERHRFRVKSRER
jgi:autotransporter-associated beta strand protein